MANSINFPTPTYAHAFELAQEFKDKWEELNRGYINEK